MSTGILDALKSYDSEWVPTQTRKFSQAEVEAILACIVVASKWGKSVCFSVVGGKKYIPLEPIASVNIGDSLDPSKMEIVSLKYVGSDPEKRKLKDILRVRIPEPEEAETSFDDPFGLTK